MDKMDNKGNASSWRFFGGQVYLSEGLKLPKKLDLRRTPLAKGVAMLAAMSFFHSCLKSFIREILSIVKIPASEEPISQPIIWLHSVKILDWCTSSL
jgi:hypothetical protein